MGALVGGVVVGVVVCVVVVMPKRLTHRIRSVTFSSEVTPSRALVPPIARLWDIFVHLPNFLV